MKQLKYYVGCSCSKLECLVCVLALLVSDGMYPEKQQVGDGSSSWVLATYIGDLD